MVASSRYTCNTCQHSSSLQSGITDYFRSCTHIISFASYPAGPCKAHSILERKRLSYQMGVEKILPKWHLMHHQVLDLLHNMWVDHQKQCKKKGKEALLFMQSP